MALAAPLSRAGSGMPRPDARSVAPAACAPAIGDTAAVRRKQLAAIVLPPRLLPRPCRRDSLAIARMTPAYGGSGRGAIKQPTRNVSRARQSGWPAARRRGARQFGARLSARDRTRAAAPLHGADGAR